MNNTPLVVSSARNRPHSKREYHPGYHGLKDYYRVRRNQLTQQPPLSSPPRSWSSARMGEQTEIPDTSNWKTADERDPSYIFAQHVADNVGKQLACRYHIIRHQSGQGSQDTTDSPNKVVKFKTISSKNPQDKDETDYYLKIEVDAPNFKYIIAHVGVTPGYLAVLYESWTTNT